MKLEVENIIRNEKLSRLLTQNTRSVLSSAVLGSLLLYIQAQQASIPLQHIYLWGAILLAISFARIGVSLYFAKHPVTAVADIDFRLNMLRAGVIITAFSWGVNPYLAGKQQSIELLFFSSFIISGMSAGAVIAYAIDKISALAYIFFAVVPLLIYLLVLNTQATLIMGFAGAIYVVFMVYSISGLNQHLIDNIVLRIEAEQFDEQIKQMAYYDALTGLPNRRLLQDKLDHALTMSQRHQMRGAVIFIDLDNFKMLNDTQGHEMGDSLLKQVASRLKSSVRESDLVSRLGGDEFIIMLENLSTDKQKSIKQAREIAEKILLAFSQPFQINHQPYFVSPSIGVAIFPTHGTTHDDLLKYADTAMYEAKRAGRNTVRIYGEKEVHANELCTIVKYH